MTSYGIFVHDTPKCILFFRCMIAFVVLQHNSIIGSSTNLAVYGQGLLQLTGHGDAIKGQRLSLSLFYNITVRHW